MIFLQRYLEWKLAVAIDYWYVWVICIVGFALILYLKQGKR